MPSVLGPVGRVKKLKIKNASRIGMEPLRDTHKC